MEIICIAIRGSRSVIGQPIVFGWKGNFKRKALVIRSVFKLGYLLHTSSPSLNHKLPKNKRFFHPAFILYSPSFNAKMFMSWLIFGTEASEMAVGI